jgi:hypothetical protein
MTKWNLFLKCKNYLSYKTQTIRHHINRKKEENIIISIDLGKEFDKVQHNFIKKKVIHQE